MLLTVVLLLVAVGLLVAALGTDRTALAWGSVGVSAVVAAMILVRWRRRRNAPEAEPVGLLDDEPVEAAHGDQQMDASSVDAGLVDPGSIDAGQGDQLIDTAQADPVSTSAGAGQVNEDAELVGAEPAEPGEEDTDAADLLVVYELIDEVLVIDEHPRYHLTRCPWPDQSRAERLPVREARELGFTPCDRCRPDTALARRHRTASATTGTSATTG